MGGYGSGRWHYADTRPVAEDGLVLSLKPMKEALAHCAKHEGNMQRGGVSWSIRDRNISSISYVMTAHDITLIYTHTRRDGSKLDINERVRLERVPKHFGGYQTYFLCPKCGRRSGKLYSPPGSPYFRCRKCCNITYRSCNESGKYDRLGPLLGVDWARFDRLTKAYKRLETAKGRRAITRAVIAIGKAQRGGQL